MKEKAMHGKPHVRFDEGGVAAAMPRRGSLLYGNERFLVVCVSILAFAVSVTVLAGAVAIPFEPRGDEDRTAEVLAAVESADWQPAVVFRNNIARMICARAVLLTTPGKTLIEGNLFDRVSSQVIQLEGERMLQ